MSVVTTFEITNSCTCENYDEDTDTSTPAEYCYGDCYQDNRDNLYHEIVKPWFERNDLAFEDKVLVVCKNVNWDHVDGVTTAVCDREGFIDALSINTEWRLDFRLDGNRLTARRYSHDEPMGSAEFFFVPEAIED
jgi:hypothetical protein